MPDELLPFQLDRCAISGYRALADVELNLGTTNLVVGINGAGKTSLLRALAFLLEDVARRIGPKPASGARPTMFDFRSRRIEFTGDFSTTGNRYRLRRSWQLADGQVTGSFRFSSPTPAVNAIAKAYWQAIEEEDPNVSLPLLAFYPISRAVRDIPLRVRKEEPASRRAGYARAFTAERHFEGFFQWFRELEDVENETRKPDPHLNAVRRAVEAAMHDYTNLRVSRRPRLRMLLDKGDEILAVQQLSDGEQGVLTLVGDLARRAAILNPHLEDPLHSPGCVLVDEIDQHLHPQWQRRVVETLRRVFPNVQFVFTSHSPIVCGSVEPNSLLILRDGRVETGSVYGWSMAEILKAVFDVDERPRPIHEDLAALDRALDAEDLDGARRLVARLREHLPDTDPEIVRANVILPMLEEAARSR